MIDAQGGRLLSVRNALTNGEYAVTADSCRIELDDGLVDIGAVRLVLSEQTQRSCTFVGRSGKLGIERRYRFPADRAYFDRHLRITNRSKDASLVVTRVTDCSLSFVRPFSSSAFH